MIGRVPFPYTVNGAGAGVAHIVVSSEPVMAPERYMHVEQATDQDWFIVDTLYRDASTSLSVTSALNLLRRGRKTFVSTELDSVGGASLGLATVLAMSGITTKVVCTGYVQGFGVESPDMHVDPIDCVDEKIAWCVQNGKKIVVPLACRSPSILRMLRDGSCVTFSTVFGHRHVESSVGVVDSVPAAIFVVREMSRH